MKLYKKSLLPQIFIIILILLTALFVSQNLYQLNLIHGDSMLPAYKNMELTVIDKRADNFTHGDVIVFYCSGLECLMIKRIIAVPGETVLISDGSVFVNGIPSPYVCQKVDFGGVAANGLLLDSDQFFVLGDNYRQSQDSRYAQVGCVSRQSIRGRLIPNRPPKQS